MHNKEERKRPLGEDGNYRSSSESGNLPGIGGAGEHRCLHSPYSWVALVRALANLQGHSSASPVTPPVTSSSMKGCIASMHSPSPLHTNPELDSLGPAGHRLSHCCASPLDSPTWSERDSAGYHCAPAQRAVQLRPPCQSIKAKGHAYECTERGPRVSCAHRGRPLLEWEGAAAHAQRAPHPRLAAVNQTTSKPCTTVSAAVPMVRYP